MAVLYVVRRVVTAPYSNFPHELFFAHPRPMPGERLEEAGWLDIGVWIQAEAMVLRRDEAVQVLKKFPDAVMVPISNPAGV